jgi:hypothetical protein
MALSSVAGGDAATARSRVWLILSICVFLAFLNLLAFDYVLDDACIAFRYAGNLVHYGSLYYNAPERGPFGFSNPLYVFMLAGLDLISVERLPFELGSRMIASVSLGLILFLLLQEPLVRSWSSGRWPGFLLAGCSGYLTLLFPFLVANFFGGLETAALSLVLFILLSALFVAEISDSAFLVCLAIGLGLRVDSGFTLLPVIAMYLFRGVSGSEKSARQRVLGLGAVFAFLAGLFLCQFLLAGTVIPLSFAHKSQAFSRETFQDYVLFFLICLLPLMVIICRRGFDRFVAFALSLAIYISLFYSFFMHWHIERYVFPFAVALFFVSLRVLFRVWRPADWRSLGLLVVYASFAFVAVAPQGFSWLSGYRVAMINAEKIAAAFTSARMPKGYRTFACFDAGCIAWKSGWKIVDLGGLTTPEVVHQDVGTVIEEARPTVLIVTTAAAGDPSTIRLRSQYHDRSAAIPPAYRFVTVLSLTNRYWWEGRGYFYYIFVNEHADAALVKGLREISVDVDQEMGFQKPIAVLIEKLARRVAPASRAAAARAPGSA